VLPFLPLNTALLLAFVSREVRALHQEATAYTRLSFILVSGMVLIVLSGLLLNLPFMLSGSPLLLLLFLPFMCAAVIVAIRSLFKLRNRTQANPKDASPFEMNSSQKPHEYRG
jgi:F0F1-type ATP synthase assembly protein I